MKQERILKEAIRLNPRISTDQFHKKTTSSLKVDNERKKLYFPHKGEVLNGRNFRAPYDTPMKETHASCDQLPSKNDALRASQKEVLTDQWFNQNVFTNITLIDDNLSP